MLMQMLLTPYDNVNCQPNTLIDQTKKIYRTYSWDDEIDVCYSNLHAGSFKLKVSSVSLYDHLIVENNIVYKILHSFSKSSAAMGRSLNPEYESVNLLLKHLSPIYTNTEVEIFESNENFIIKHKNSYIFTDKKCNNLLENKNHRLDGPAVIYKFISRNDQDGYFINGEMFEKDQWRNNKLVEKNSLKQKIEKL